MNAHFVMLATCFSFFFNIRQRKPYDMLVENVGRNDGRNVGRKCWSKMLVKNDGRTFFRFDNDTEFFFQNK